MNRKIPASLPLLALLTGLTALAQQPIGQQLPSMPPLVRQPVQRGSQEMIAASDLNRQTSFLKADSGRIYEILKLAAPVVRNRYMQVARPAIPLGRLIRVPYCGGSTGRGVLVPGQVTGNGMVSIDANSYPNFENCVFIFETYAPESGDNAPFDLENQTALYANLRVRLAFDSVLGRQIAPSGLRTQTQPITRLNIEITGEPYVYQALPNVPPPITFSEAKLHKPNWSGKSDIEGLEDLRDFGFTNQGKTGFQNRMAIARRMIEGHAGGVANLASVVEQQQLATVSFDPCGETPRPSAGLVPPNLIFERCYTYTSRTLAPTSASPDNKYRGQLRVLFQKDARSPKIIGIRAFAFGGNI